MQKEIFDKDGTKITYDLQYKQVKNINLRIKPDGTVHVSANRRVPLTVIEGFLFSKKDFILKALKRCEACETKPLKHYFSEEEVRRLICELCKDVYPYFESKGVEYPQIKFRRMVSRWGSCHTAKGILTFNTNLMYASVECIEYVVLHEFTHFLQANHSKQFYYELEKVCPRWKEYRNILKTISLRRLDK